MATEAEQQHLLKLQDYYATFRSFPSYKQLAEVLGLASPSSVSWVLNRLQREGYLARTPHGQWVPSGRFYERQLANIPVRAGFPAEVENADLDPFFIDEYMVEEPSSTILIVVRGDSMKDAGILDGDVALVERTPHANVHDLVVAIIDREFTLKTLGKEEGKYVLIPANPNYPTIRPKGDLRIYGIVRGIIRKYRH